MNGNELIVKEWIIKADHDLGSANLFFSTFPTTLTLLHFTANKQLKNI